MIGVLLCQGDSGGPLTKNGVLVGVVSGGDATGSSCNVNVSMIFLSFPKYANLYS